MPQQATMLGNDIVDFRIDEQKYNNPRFINRVLTTREQLYLKQSPSPNRFLWSLWAAKEAGYKAQQRNHQQLTFSPIGFTLSESTLQQLLTHDCHDELCGKVYFEDNSIEIKLNWPKQHVVHCLALIESNTGKWSNIDYKVAYAANLDSYRHQSEAVRRLAEELLQQNHIKADILRPSLTMAGYNKPGPPTLIDRESGQPLSDIISLSHDNNHLAAALLLIS